MISITMRRRLGAMVTTAVVATALAAASAPPVHAADAAITAPTTMYTGGAYEFSFKAGAETGAYTADVMSGSTRVARIASGDQIDDLGAVEATAKIAWVVPTTMKLEGTGYTLSVTAGSTTLTSNAFTVAAPSISSVSTPSSTEAGGSVWISWSSSGLVGNKVAINLVPASGSGRVAIAKATDNDGSDEFRLPAKVVPGSWKIEVVPNFKHAKGLAGTAFTVTTRTVPAITMHGTTTFPDLNAPEPTTFSLGTKVYLSLPSGPDGERPELTLFDSSGKKKLVQYGTGMDEGGFFPRILLGGPKVIAGTYLLKGTYSSDKLLVATQELVLTAPTAPTVTAPALAAGVTHGQQVPITVKYMTTGNSPTIDTNRATTIGVLATDGSTTVKVGTKKQLDGSALFNWVVPATLAPGSAWKLKIVDEHAGDALLAETSAFTIASNPTTLAKKVPADSIASGATTSGLSSAATLYTGAVATFGFTAGSETGAYTLDLYKGSTYVARIGGGTQIDDLGAASAAATITWTIPSNLKLEGTGYHAVLTAGSSRLATDTFAIAASSTTSVALPGGATHTIGYPTEVTWSSLGATGDLVAIDLVPASGKAINVVPQTDNDGTAHLSLPTKFKSGVYTVKIRPLTKTAATGAGVTLTVAAPSIAITIWPIIGPTNPTSAPIGGLYDMEVDGIPDGSTADVVLANPANKKILMDLASDVDYFYERVNFLDKRLVQAGTGTYQIWVLVDGAKTPAKTYSIDFIPGGLQIAAATLTRLQSGVTHGESLTLQWNSGLATLGTTVQVTNGSKTFVLDADEYLFSGAGSYVWNVSDKLPVGTAWKLQLIDNRAKKGAAPFAESPAFTIKANPTIPGKKIKS